jgi:hypothetical protein
MSASAVEPPRHLLYPFVIALAENGSQQNLTARIDPLDDAIPAAFNPEISLVTLK